MKYLLIIILFFSIAGSATAKENEYIYITYNNKTKQVVDISKRADVRMPKDKYTTDKKKMKITNLKLSAAPQMYNYINEELIIDEDRVLDDFKKRESDFQILQEEKMIQKRLRELAIKSIELEGYKFRHIKKDK